MINQIEAIGIERTGDNTYSAELDNNGWFNDKLGKRLATYKHRNLAQFLNSVEEND